LLVRSRRRRRNKNLKGKISSLPTKRAVAARMKHRANEKPAGACPACFSRTPKPRLLTGFRKPDPAKINAKYQIRLLALCGAPVFRLFLALKDSQTSRSLIQASGISAPSPLPEVQLTAPASRELGPFHTQRSATFGILRTNRSRVSASLVTKMRHTTNSAFTINQTISHPVIPT
jgi:hypothetical protein